MACNVFGSAYAICMFVFVIVLILYMQLVFGILKMYVSSHICYMDFNS